MSRFGTKELLNYWAGTDQYLDYNFIPGVQTETMGRNEFYADFMCSSVYAWSDYLPDKLTKDKKYVHLGASPFLYADALVPRQNRKGTCIFYLNLMLLLVWISISLNMKQLELL